MEGASRPDAVASQPPDVLLIVLDCVRADLFDAVLAEPGAMPFLRGLQPEVLDFSGAVSTSSWTVPGHASLFTGLYPWDHGAHYRNGPILTREPETIAECLGHAGYATAMFSANAYVQASTGLTRGFDQSAWGGAREFYLRFTAPKKATCPNLGGPALVWLPPQPKESLPSPLRDLAMLGFSRVPAAWDGLNRVGGKVLGTYGKEAREVSPWIEPELGRWLEEQPKDKPVFAFVNLFEAHEPYLAGGGFPVGFGSWLKFVARGQDIVMWVDERWRPDESELAKVRDAYLASLRTLDRRIRAIVETFSKTRNWDRTLFVLTSDHGQAFLEEEILYHRFRVDETLLRVPLWVRAPGGHPAGRRTLPWVSQIDVPRTLSALVGRDSFGDPASVSLLELEDAELDRTVYAMSDGIPAGQIPHVGEERRRFLDRLEIAAYHRASKGVVREDGTTGVYAAARPMGAVRLGDAAHGPEADVALAEARRVYDLATSRIASRPFHGSVEKRIAGWGY